MERQFDESKVNRDGKGRFTFKYAAHISIDGGDDGDGPGGGGGGDGPKTGSSSVDLITDYPKIDKGGFLENPTKSHYEPETDCQSKVDAFKDQWKKHPEGGTLLISTGKVVKMKKGYQVSFMRPPGEISFTKEEYDEISNWIMKKTGSRLFAGFWKGTGPKDPGGAEPSFWCENKRVAKEIAKLFNQASIFNWKAASKGDRKNIYISIVPHTDGLKLDKEAILRKIREDK